MWETQKLLDLSRLDLSKLNPKAIEKLHEDYTRNAIIYLYNESALPKEVEKAKQRFIENGYDPDVTATNADFKAKAQERFPEIKDKLELQTKAEQIKTEYTTKLMRLQDIMAKQVTNAEQTNDAIALLDGIVEIKESMNLHTK